MMLGAPKLHDMLPPRCKEVTVAKEKEKNLVAYQQRHGKQIKTDRKRSGGASQSALVGHLHLKDLNAASRHRRCGRSRTGGHSILIADEGLRVEFEGFAHELSDAVQS